MSAVAVDVGEVLQRVFCDVLGLREIDPDTSFLDLGGVSIEAEEIALKLSEELALRIDAVDILSSENLQDVRTLVRRRLSEE